VKGRAVLAGGLAAWSTLTLLQVVPAFLLVVMLLLRRGRLLPFCVAWIGPVAAVTAVLSWATDGAYWRQTVSFHLAKVAISDGNGGSLSPLLRHDQVLLVLGLIACFVLSWRTDADTRWTAVASATSITINVLFFAQRPVVFGWYLVPLFLCLSILLGSAAAALFERSEHRAHTLARLAVPLLAGAVVLLAGERLTASSLGQPLPVASLEEIVSFLRARRQDDGSLTVFGDSSVTPWIALYAGVEVTQMHVDTNVQRFLTDPGLCARLTGVLENHPSTVIVTRDSGGIGTLPCFRTFLKTRYERVALFSDPVTNVAYQLFSLSR
jgi:hypothetical protein